MDYRHRVIPFYMAYQQPWFVRQEDCVTRDLEYLQQMYPAQAKKYQRRIMEVVDRMDYEGSLIYDEYPDRWQLYRLAESILEIIRREDESYEDGAVDNEAAREKWEMVADMIQILLFHEIYRRRHCAKKSFMNF